MLSPRHHITKKSLSQIVSFLLLSFLLVALHSCSGYQVVRRQNPFRQYGIQRLGVPLFFNDTIFGRPHLFFHREIIRLLSRSKDLELSAKINDAQDAVLLGIVSSPEQTSEAIINSGQLTAPQSLLGNRSQIAIPVNQSLRLALRIILIRHPSELEIRLLAKELKKAKLISPKIVFDRTIAIDGAMVREYLFDAEGKQVNYVRNMATQNRYLEQLALQAARQFESEILYAF